jgi:hypothetical protein
MKFLHYLRDRFNEPGSKRSLAVVAWGVSSAANSPDVWAAGIDVALVVLGAWSFMEPEGGKQPPQT